MFVWGNLIAIALLFVGMSAHAAETEYFRLATDPTEVALRIQIPTVSECRASVQEMLFPAEPMKAGLDLLAEINGPSQSEKISQCLGQALESWGLKNYPELVSQATGTETAAADGSPLPSPRLRELEELHRCAENLLAPGVAPPGCSALVPKEEWEQLKPEWEKENALQYEKFSDWGRRRVKVMDLLAWVPPRKTAPPEELQRLYTKQNCFRNADPAQFAADEAAKPSCKGLWQAEPLTKEESALITELQNQTNQEEVDAIMAQSPLSVFLNQPASLEQIEKSGLFKLAEELKCSNDAAPGTFLRASVFKEKETECKGKWLDSAAATQVKEKFAAAMAPLLGAAEKWQAERKASFPARQLEFDRTHEKESRAYAAQRLMAHFSAFVRQGADVSDSENFCAGYAEKMRKDRNYLASQPAYFRQWHSIAYFPSGWAKAMKYGVSEADIMNFSAYTGAYYLAVNSALLGKFKLTPEIAAFKEAFDRSLQRLPLYANGPVLRFVSLPSEVLAKHQVGATVCYPSYSSTSYDPEWHWGGDQKMLIYPGKKGRLLDVVSEINSEKEVLFEAGTCFKVLSRKNGKENKLDFVLAEVDEHGQVIAKIPEKEQP